jgi:hemerythrin
MAESSPKFDEMLAEHHHLKELFQKIQTVVAGGVTRRDELGVLIDELQQDILQHFAHEENAGFFDHIVAMAPQLVHETTLLKHQHKALASLLEDIATTLRREDLSAEQMQQVADLIYEFRVRFGEHEEGENQLLQEAFDRDVGSKD